MDDRARVIGFASQIVTAYVSSNRLSPGELPALIQQVHAALGAGGGAAAPAAHDRPTPAQIRRSITPQGLISFIDGRSYQLLKRHVARHGLTLAQYKARYGLPEDYPTISQAYRDVRRAAAKAAGLGKGRRMATRAKPR